MSLVDVLCEVKKNNVMKDTWGHLYPEPGSKHKGYILIAHGEYGGTTILDYHFETHQCSPQAAEVIATSMDMYEWTQGIYKLECTLWFFKHCNDMYISSSPIGKIIKPKLITLNDLRKLS